MACFGSVDVVRAGSLGTLWRGELRRESASRGEAVVVRLGRIRHRMAWCGLAG